MNGKAENENLSWSMNGLENFQIFELINVAI